jgi:histidine triad (HIT) family protein
MERKPFDLQTYLEDIGTRPCFICGTVANDPRYFHHRVWEDDETIIFLSKYPTLPGTVWFAQRHTRRILPMIYRARNIYAYR